MNFNFTKLAEGLPYAIRKEAQKKTDTEYEKGVSAVMKGVQKSKGKGGAGTRYETPKGKGGIPSGGEKILLPGEKARTTKAPPPVTQAKTTKPAPTGDIKLKAGITSKQFGQMRTKLEGYRGTGQRIPSKLLSDIGGTTLQGVAKDIETANQPVRAHYNIPTTQKPKQVSGLGSMAPKGMTSAPKLKSPVPQPGTQAASSALKAPQTTQGPKFKPMTAGA